MNTRSNASFWITSQSFTVSSWSLSESGGGATPPHSPVAEIGSSTGLPRNPPRVSRMTLRFQPGSRPDRSPPSRHHKALLHGVSSPRSSYPGHLQLLALPHYLPARGPHIIRACLIHAPMLPQSRLFLQPE